MKSINLIKKTKFLFKNLYLTKVRKKKPKTARFIFNTSEKSHRKWKTMLEYETKKKSLKNRKKPEQTRANILNPQSIKY
jgi:hypothetical protein